MSFICMLKILQKLAISFRVKTTLLIVTYKALLNLYVPLNTSPTTTYSCFPLLTFQHTLLLPNIQKYQAQLHLRSFAPAVPFAWNLLPLDTHCLSHSLSSALHSILSLHKGLPGNRIQNVNFSPLIHSISLLLHFSPFQLSPSNTLCNLLICHSSAS